MQKFKIVPCLTTVYFLFLVVDITRGFDPARCLGLGDGLYSDPTNCGAFYRCTAQAAELFLCPRGSMFDEGQGLCVVDAPCPLTCPPPPPAPWKSNVSSPVTPGPFDTADYTCEPSYRPKGNPQLTCGTDGKWIGSVPTCERVGPGAPQQRQWGGTRVMFGYRYAGSAIGVYNETADPWRCADLCWAAPTCVSANFMKPGIFKCELLTDKPSNYSVLDVTPVNNDFIELFR